MNGFQLQNWEKCKKIMNVYDIEHHTDDSYIVLRKKNHKGAYYEYLELYKSTEIQHIMIFVDGYDKNEYYRRLNNV